MFICMFDHVTVLCFPSRDVTRSLLIFARSVYSSTRKSTTYRYNSQGMYHATIILVFHITCRHLLSLLCHPIMA